MSCIYGSSVSTRLFCTVNGCPGCMHPESLYGNRPYRSKSVSPDYGLSTKCQLNCSSKATFLLMPSLLGLDGVSPYRPDRQLQPVHQPKILQHVPYLSDDKRLLPNFILYPALFHVPPEQAPP
ncbi:hypothetical protein AVEN_116931-1 [Araneus ventricosus]|uniref:Uncharacterized protein n=1 Tax=Araneus ventricosus TaxID=182803 RepID=A0A4Y2V8Y0_ARAVE|nr:hypothetical protein AVEN_116931-1 [Araneus ventricosus]